MLNLRKRGPDGDLLAQLAPRMGTSEMTGYGSGPVDAWTAAEQQVSANYPQTPPQAPPPQAPPPVQQPDNGGGGSPGSQYHPPTLSELQAAIESDPALAAIRAAQQAAVAKKQAAALELKRNKLRQFGDRGLAEQVLGANDPTLGAISSDPNTSTSTLAQLARAYEGNRQTANDKYNDANANLFYSTTRTKGLADLEAARQTDVAGATSSLRDLLAGIDQGVLDTELQGNSDVASGINDAAMRAILESIQFNTGSGGPDTTPAAADVPASVPNAALDGPVQPRPTPRIVVPASGWLPAQKSAPAKKKKVVKR